MAKEQRLKVEFQNRVEEAVRVGFEADKETWNYYVLDDGTTMKMKTVVSDVVRLLSTCRQDGEPIYMVKSTNIVETIAPEHLKMDPSKRREVN